VKKSMGSMVMGKKRTNVGGGGGGDLLYRLGVQVR